MSSTFGRKAANSVVMRTSSPHALLQQVEPSPQMPFGAGSQEWSFPSLDIPRCSVAQELKVRWCPDTSLPCAMPLLTMAKLLAKKATTAMVAMASLRKFRPIVFDYQGRTDS